MPARRLGHALTVAAFVALVMPLSAAPASAHGRLVSTSPAGGSTVATGPSSIRLLFDEAVQSHFAAVVVTGPSGSRLGRGGPDVAGTTVAQPVGPLTAGGYLVAYRVVSADGHPVSGQFRFRYAPAALATPTADPSAPSPRQPAAGSTRPAASRPADTGAGGGHLLHYVGSVLAIVVTLAVVAVERLRRPAAGVSVTAASTRPARRTATALALGVAAAAGVTLVVALIVGGGRPQPAPAGLPDAGAATGWALQLVRLAANAAGVLVVGQLLAAALLFPAPGGTLLATSLRALRAAAVISAAWAALAVAALLLSYAELVGRPLPQALDPGNLWAFVQAIPQAQALVLQATLGLAVAVLTVRVVAPAGAAAVLLIAVLGLLPPALSGHAGASGDHMLALSSLTVHLVAVSLWVGGLAALAVAACRRTALLAPAVRRFSPLALWCLVAVGVSGLVNAALRVWPPSALVTSGYGLLVLAKVAALVALAAFGWVHRRRSLPALSGAGSGAAFARLAAVEMGAMFATIGLAVALAGSPPPVDQNPDLTQSTPARVLLGYDLPPAPTVGRLLFDVRLDGFALTAAVLAVALYLTGVRSLRRRGLTWPASRTILWLLGWSVVVLATSSGLGRYAEVLFSAHMAQHMALSMVAPIPLVLAAPVTLALRVLPAASARAGGTPGVREWLVAALHSRPVRVLAHPVVAAAIFVGSLYALYFTPLFELAMRNHLGHVLMEAHFLAVGGLFFWVLIGPDPAPRRPPYLARVVTLFATIAAHAFFSVALLSGTSVIAPSYYAALSRPWGPSLLDDQQLGGGIGWAFGELPVWLVMGALFVQWYRADARAARRVDRSEGTDHDELVAYNEWLARLGRSAGAGDRRRR